MTHQPNMDYYNSKDSQVKTPSQQNMRYKVSKFNSGHKENQDMKIVVNPAPTKQRYNRQYKDYNRSESRSIRTPQSAQSKLIHPTF